MSGLLCKLLQILELRTAVALAEGVDMIDVAQYRPRSLGETGSPRSSEISRRHDAAVNVRHAGCDEPSRLEPALPLDDLHRANLARPRIEILEQVAVDCLQVLEIEIARRYGLKKAVGDKLALCRFKR